MMEPNYRDGSAQCGAIGRRVTFRCGLNGVVTCRGPDSVKGFYRKCKEKASAECALSFMASGMRAALKGKKIQIAPRASKAGYVTVKCRGCGTAYDMPDLRVIPIMNDCPECKKEKEN